MTRTSSRTTIEAITDDLIRVTYPTGAVYEYYASQSANGYVWRTQIRDDGPRPPRQQVIYPKRGITLMRAGRDMEKLVRKCLAQKRREATRNYFDAGEVVL